MLRAHVVVAFAVNSLLTTALIAGHGPWAGHELFALSADHGVNSGDVPILVLWLVGTLSCWRLWVGTSRARRERR